MAMDNKLSIVLQYRLVGSAEWITQPLSRSEYFELEPDEEADLDSIPRHNHACEYLSFPLSRLAATRIVLAKAFSGRRTIHETFWGDGRHRLIERVDEGSEPYREVILNTEVQTHPNRVEIIRMEDHEGQMKLNTHVIFETLPDGTEKEEKLFHRNDTRTL